MGRRWAAAGAPGAAPLQPAEPGAWSNRAGQPAASRGAARARWSHSAIKRPLGERPRREEVRGWKPPQGLREGLEQGLEQSLGRRAVMSLLGQKPADENQLSGRATQPRAGLEPAAPEDVQGCFGNPGPTGLQVKKVCFPARAESAKGDLMGSGTAGHSL